MRAESCYPADRLAFGGLVLGDWLLDKPIPLDDVTITLSEQHHPIPDFGPTDHVLPLRTEHERYPDYSSAVADLARPRLFENRLCYRLLDVSRDNGLALTFGTTTYFELFNRKESLAHEFKKNQFTLRESIGDPFDPAKQVLSAGIGTLTIRRDPRGHHRFLVHQRDGKTVADGMDICAVIPAGEFQPTTPDNLRHDFSLWRNIMREFAEELLGFSEPQRTVDYDREHPFTAFHKAYEDNELRVWHYGLIMDPLTLGAGQRTVAVIDSDAFDHLFADLVDTNEEGAVRAVPFTEQSVADTLPRMTGPSQTLLRLAWRDRDFLLV
ncbi:hypothetical protein [Actinokineospora enzanensis]|uniref:hypothetical protein n=1 Tax=Actinokineospora enzanensis TaxID=155975 RepID=UPI0003826114|nr:hypothetical protein [Actinokineospora enzanensis]